MVTAGNAIGLFVVGQSQIGDIPVFDVNETVISQYANSSILMQLITDFAACLDPTKTVSDFFDMLWNIDTAQGVGLDIWGRIVGVKRVVPIAPDLDFGFQEAGGTSAVGFGQGEFFGGGAATTNATLSDDAFRILILAKALANITDCAIPSINQIMMSLFPGRGDCHVVDNEDMSLTYVFTFPTTAVEKSIIQGSGVLPRPVGVFANYTFA